MEPPISAGPSPPQTIVKLPPTELGRTTVFKQTLGRFYRIPALISFTEEKSEQETYIAFAEWRKTLDDADAKHLVMRRGNRNNNDIEWEDIQELDFAVIRGHRTMNPCPVYERESKTLFLFFICVEDGVTEQKQIRECKNAARLCYISSRDKGLSWSIVTDLTTMVIGDQIKYWATFAVGPGHGIQMRNGRLIVPAYAYHIRCGCCIPSWCCCKKRSQAFCFYSVDKGETWQVGSEIANDSNECQMAEIIDQGKNYLYCNARSKQCRVEALSSSEGAMFEESCLAKKLVEQGDNGCQGSVISFPAPKSRSEEQKDVNMVDRQTWLLFSHPTNESQRADLGVYLNRSPSKMSGWEAPKIIQEGPSGYSDLTYNERTEYFACLVESGKDCEKIVFVEFSLRNDLNAIDENI